MPLTLVTTPGSPTANSYCSIAEAAAWHATQLGQADWDTHPETQAQALAMATGIFDRACRWKGDRASLTQALAWPRVGVYYHDTASTAGGDASGYGWSGSGLPIPSTIIPQFLVQATAELAKALILDARGDDPASLGLTSLKIGPFAFGLGSGSEQRPLLPPMVRHLIAPYVVSTVSSIVKVVGRA